MRGTSRQAIKEDLLQFALPGLLVFLVELMLCADRLDGFWGRVWSLIKRPAGLFEMPVAGATGLALFMSGLLIMVTGQITLRGNYSGTVKIRVGHTLITNGIYRYSRNPIYLGGLMCTTGIPLHCESLVGLFVSLALVPIVLNRIRLEERLLGEEFGDSYREYKKATTRLIPFVW